MYRKKEETQTSTAPSPFQTIEEAVEHAKRAFALKKYEQSVDHYATALELAYVAFDLSLHSQFIDTRLQDWEVWRRCTRDC